MNKKYKFLLAVLIIVLIGAVVWYFFLGKKKENIPFASIKMIEGRLIEKGSGTIVLKNANAELDYSTMTEKKSDDLISFSVHKEVILEEYTPELKSEEEIQSEQTTFENWQRKPEGEKNAFSLLFPPVWNKSKKISFSNLEKGDLLRVAYYNSGEKNIIVKIVKEIKTSEDNSEERKVKNYSLTANILEITNNKLSVKTSSDVSIDIPVGKTIDLVIDDQTLIKRMIIKKESEFREEEAKSQKEREKVRAAGGGVFSVPAPSRFQESNISVNALTKDKDIDVEAAFDGQTFKALSIQQIIK